MAVVKYKNENNYESIPILDIDNSTPLDLIEKSLYFKVGDSFTGDTHIATGGFVTSSRTSFRWTITLPKSMKNITTITDNGSTIQIRQNAKYLCGDGSSTAMTTSQIVNFSKINFYKLDDRNLEIILTLSSAETNSSNNSPIGVNFRPKLKFS